MNLAAAWAAVVWVEWAAWVEWICKASRLKVKTYFEPALVRQKSRAKPDDFCLMAKPKHVKKIIQKAR
jgi:hypothetical protein